MMSKIRRAASMALFHTIRMVLKMVDFLSPRAYMRIYLQMLRLAGVKLSGVPRYISTGVKFDDFRLITLGDRVVISDRVVLLTHDYSITTAIICLGSVPESDIAVRKGISIGDNVFVGLGSILLPGTEIGDNVIVGAGSVVRGRVPSNTLILGNPATAMGSVSDLGERWRTRIDSTQVSAD